MSLPIDRTNKTALDVNLVNGVTSDAPKLKANNDTVYDTSDELYNFVLGLISGGTLQPYPFGVNRNAIINGDFSVNQRVVSGTVTLAAGQYGHDRWKAGSGGCTYTFSTVNNITTITITSGTLVQVIEGINLFSDTYSLSWQGTAQGRIGGGSYGNSGITASVTAGTNLSIEFGTGTLSRVDFNKGTIAVPFQPRSIAEELALCQRYYEKSYVYENTPGTSGDDIYMSAIVSPQPALLVSYPLKVEKRISNPTLTIYKDDGTSGNMEYSLNGGAYADIPAVVAVATSKNIGFGWSAFTAGDRAMIRGAFTVDAEL